MTYAEKIKNIVDSLDMGRPTFNIQVRGKYLAARENDWTPTLNNKNFTENLIKSCVNRYRRFSLKHKEYQIDVPALTNEIIIDQVDDVINIFTECSPYDQPRRTNIYKDFVEVVKNNRYNEQFRNAVFDISEYYFNSTRTESITRPSNDVHRKNIYHLLCLMEKSYGKKTSNQ